jgi:hypothetical protein
MDNFLSRNFSCMWNVLMQLQSMEIQNIKKRYHDTSGYPINCYDVLNGENRCINPYINILRLNVGRTIIIINRG